MSDITTKEWFLIREFVKLARRYKTTQPEDLMASSQGQEIFRKAPKADTSEIERLEARRESDEAVLQAYGEKVDRLEAELATCHDRLTDMLKHLMASDFGDIYPKTMRSVTSWFTPEMDYKNTRAEVIEKTCEWKRSTDLGYIDSGCNVGSILMCDFEDFTCCPYCGGRIVEVTE